MSSFISGNFPPPYPSTVSNNKQVQQVEQRHRLNVQNDSDVADRVSISPEAAEILAKIQEQQTTTNDNSNDKNTSQDDLFAVLGRFLGLKGTTQDKTAFLSLLNKSIADESKSLTKVLAGLLKETGLDDVTKKITFAEDKDGNIVVKGNINAKKKRELAARINNKPELVERIKNQKAKMEIAAELQKEEVSDFAQLLKNMPGLAELLQNDPAEQQTLQKQKDSNPGKQLKIQDSSKDVTETRSLLAMKRGVLSEATDDEKNFDADVQKFREQIGALVKEYNETVVANDYDLRVTDFSVRIDENGNVNIEDVQTRNGDTKQTLNALQFLRKHAGSFRGTAKELATKILDDHDDRYGDVQEYKHEVVIESGVFSDFRIESPEADRAALAKMQTLGNEIGKALGLYWGLSEPFEITFNADGKLSIDAATLAGSKGKNIRETLIELNKRLEFDDPFADEIFGNKLSFGMEEILDHLVELKETRDQIHNPTLRNLSMSMMFG